jgi:hypothetical protein
VKSTILGAGNWQPFRQCLLRRGAPRFAGEAIEFFRGQIDDAFCHGHNIQDIMLKDKQSTKNIV